MLIRLPPLICRKTKTYLLIWAVSSSNIRQPTSAYHMGPNPKISIRYLTTLVSDAIS